jgi:hypothetical protein
VKNCQEVTAMLGNTQLGAVLYELRQTRRLTLAAVARQAGCAESLLSYVESGGRQLHPWLAAQLDDIYRTGGVIAALLRGTNHRFNGGAGEVLQDDILIVELLGGGVSMPLPRRELLASLGVGVVGGQLLAQFDKATESISVGDDTLQSFEDAYAGFQAAAPLCQPRQFVQPLLRAPSSPVPTPTLVNRTRPHSCRFRL